MYRCRTVIMSYGQGFSLVLMMCFRWQFFGSPGIFDSSDNWPFHREKCASFKVWSDKNTSFKIIKQTNMQTWAWTWTLFSSYQLVMMDKSEALRFAVYFHGR